MWILSLLALACCCTPKPAPEPTPDGEEEPDLSGFTAVSLKSSVTKVQPMTGIVTWSDSKYSTDDVQLEFSYMLYNDVCKEKDVFNWKPMDDLLAAVASRGHQAVVRFRYTYPGKSCAVPDYIKNWEGYEAKSGKSEGRNTEFPDWRCEELQRFHMEFHKRFAERYDTDPRLAFVQTGFGLWAEYHIYDGICIMGRTFPSHDFQAAFLPKMDEWFVHTPWMFSIDAADAYYAPFHKKKELLNLHFGNFDDSFMCEDHDGYNFESWEFFGTERYKIAPFGGEFSYYTDSDQRHCLDKTGMHGRVFEDEVAKFHMTFIIGADQPGYQSWSRIREASLSMGYKFRILDYRINGTTAAIKIANVGVAPIYRDAWVAVDGVRSDWSLAGLMPGESKWLEITVRGLSESSVVSIECDHLVKGQKIRYEANLSGEE